MAEKQEAMLQKCKWTIQTICNLTIYRGVFDKLSVLIITIPEPRYVCEITIMAWMDNEPFTCSPNFQQAAKEAAKKFYSDTE